MHAELKLLDLYMKEDSISKINSAENNKAPKENIYVFIAPSRYPCKSCSFIFEHIERLKLNSYRFILPITKKKQRGFNFRLPSFMSGIGDKKFDEIIKSIPKNERHRQKQRISIHTQDSNYSDKKKTILVDSEYTLKKFKYKSVDHDEIFRNELFSKLKSTLDCFKKNGNQDNKIKQEKNNFLSKSN